jgi:NAD(P)-dependent dehydrogenase (short-subunit alcohol dehydrogenase family)
MFSRKANRLLLTGAGIATGLQLARSLFRPEFDLNGKTVLVTGASRGLGLVLAREFTSRGAKVAMAAREPESLQRAVLDVQRFGPNVLGVDLDIAFREEADAAVEKIENTLGPIDVLVNNAGTICVGPFEEMTTDDFRDSINTHFWGPYFCSMAIIPGMRRRRRGRIVNISSIGGRLSVPHLLPYSVGKFALTGFSQGLRSALLQNGIYVTTVWPGLMRTGSPRNALFKGDNQKEYAWFSISDALPVISMNADRAARRIVDASVRGDAEIVLSLPAKIGVAFNSLCPELTADLFAAANRLLPAAPTGRAGRDTASESANEVGSAAKTGRECASSISPSWLTTLNERAAKANNEMP